MTDFVKIQCCRCKELFGMAENTYATLKRSSQNFHCPWGHPQHFPLGESEAGQLRREKQQLEQRIAMWQDAQREASERADREARRASAYKGQATRVRKRAKAGVCPCCNRSFKQLAAHMANKHPDFSPAEEPA